MAVSKARYMARRVGILAVLGFAIAGFATGQVAGATSAKASVSHYVVEGGDTLWAIAAHEAPNADQREYVSKLVDLNQLTSSVLVPGQQLLLPNN
jgi:LysM repeat protein